MTVTRRGTDTSGRAIYASDYLWTLWQSVLEDIDFTPTIVQGAWMTLAGGGASESAGYHDKGGCFDVRTWDLTADQLETLVRVLRTHGVAAWRRDHEHGGFDPHLHFVCGTDDDLAPGAARQWADYLAGRDGLAGRGPDYEWRPNPLVTTPPGDDMNPAQDDRLKAVEQAVDRIEDTLTTILGAVRAKGSNAWKRDVDLKALVKEVLAEAKKP